MVVGNRLGWRHPLGFREEQLQSWPEEEPIVGDEHALEKERISPQQRLHPRWVGQLLAVADDRVPCLAQLFGVGERHRHRTARGMRHGYAPDARRRKIDPTPRDRDTSRVL